jgi:hypothetical protein
MALDNVRKIRLVLSELGNLAYDCYNENKRQQCTVFVSSLNEEPFYTPSGRDILTWTPEVPDVTAVDSF